MEVLRTSSRMFLGIPEIVGSRAPIRFLKKVTASSDICENVVSYAPLSPVKTRMVPLRCYAATTFWKNLVFWSPSWIQASLDFCL